MHTIFRVYFIQAEILIVQRKTHPCLEIMYFQIKNQFMAFMYLGHKSTMYNVNIMTNTYCFNLFQKKHKIIN